MTDGQLCYSCGNNEASAKPTNHDHPICQYRVAPLLPTHTSFLRASPCLVLSQFVVFFDVINVLIVIFRSSVALASFEIAALRMLPDPKHGDTSFICSLSSGLPLV